MTKPSTFLVCVNDKNHSYTALHFACKKANTTGSAVKLLCVVDPVDYNTIFSVADVIKDERIATAQDLLEEMAEKAKTWTNTPPFTMVKEGRIVDEIIAAIAEDTTIDLLIVAVAADGSSSKSGLLPTLTSATGHKFHIPLLIVPGNLSDEEIDQLT